MMPAVAAAPRFADELVSKAEERHVIFASSLGTIFEWYDFYLYAVLAPFFSKLFFPAGNDTAALLAAFVTYVSDHRLAHDAGDRGGLPAGHAEGLRHPGVSSRSHRQG